MAKNETVTLSIKKKEGVTDAYPKMSTANYEIKLNDWEVGNGVRSIELNAVAGKVPELVIRCQVSRIDIEGLDVLGIAVDEEEELFDGR